MLYCISANYTPKAMQAMAKNPNTNRRDAVEKLVTAAGGKLVAISEKQIPERQAARLWDSL